MSSNVNQISNVARIAELLRSPRLIDIYLSDRKLLAYQTLFTWYSRLYNRLDVCLYDAAGCPTGCTVEQPVVRPVWQPVGCLYTRYNLLSNRLSNRFDNRLYHVYKHSADNNRLCRV